jgi:hypothetical protein
LCVPLYCMADVREITRSRQRLASPTVIASVIPSAKYSSRSPSERSVRGSTTRDRMGALSLSTPTGDRAGSLRAATSAAFSSRAVWNRSSGDLARQRSRTEARKR